MSKKFSWAAAPLSPEQETLINAYEKTGKTLDSLAYSKEFDQLVQELGEEDTDEIKREVFQQLLSLRKTGRLRRPYNIVISSAIGPLPAEDQELISAYELIGCPLDSLPYTEEFEKLIKELGKPETQAMRHAVFQRLLNLRKRGRLPRVS